MCMNRFMKSAYNTLYINTLQYIIIILCNWSITRIYMHIYACVYIRECGSTLNVGMAQGVSFSLYIGIGAKFENTQKAGERRLRTAKYRTVLL